MRCMLGRISALVLGVGVSLAAYGQALAQQPPVSGVPRANATREQLNPAQQAERPASRRAGLLDAPEIAPCPLDGSPLTFKLDGVKVEGTSLPDTVTSRAYEGLVGQTIPVSRICEIRDRLATLLFHRNILARVYVPEQTIASGTLTLKVVEARIVDVRIRPTPGAAEIGPAQDRVEAYLAKLRGLRPFDLVTAQRYLALASEVPGVRITPALRASSDRGEGDGAVDLEVEIDREPYRVVGIVQNTGSKTLGPWSAVAAVDINSLTSFGERTTLVGYHTLDNEQWIVQLAQEARFGSEGLVGRYSLAYGQSRPGDVLKDLNLKGTSFVGTAQLSYPLVRQIRSYSLWAEGGADFVNQKIAFVSSDLSNDKLRITWARLRGLLYQPLDGGLTLRAEGQVEARKGWETLGGSKKGQGTLSRLEGDPAAWDVRGDAEVRLSLREILELELFGQAQYADKPLLSYEELAAGSLTVGWGYSPSVLAGDRGAMGRVRLSGPKLPQPGQPPGAWVRPFVFYDHSRLSNLDTGSTSRTLRSYGGGAEAEVPIRWLLGDDPPITVQARLIYAEPLDKPFPTATEKPSSRVLFTLSVSR